MTAQTPVNEQQLVDPRRRGMPRWTAIGRANGRYRTYLIATCVALVLAAIGDEAPGYDGPGPFIDGALAVLVALVWWRFMPLLVVAMSTFFLVGGLASSEFVSRLVEPDQALDFAAAWLQLVSFGAAAVFSVAAMVRLRRHTLVLLAGLLVGIVGLVTQWIADPAKFSEALPPLGAAVPPGIAFIVLAGVLTVLTSRWWWHPVFAVFIAFWIVGVGTLAGQLTPNLTSSNLGTVIGNIVMAIGLVVTFVAGIRSMLTTRRTCRPAQSVPDRVRHR